LDSSLAGNDLDFFLNGKPEVPKTPPFTPNPFTGVQSLFGGIEPGPPIPLRCLFRRLLPWLFLWPLPRRYPFHKEMALCIMTPQPAISSTPQHMEVASEFASHNLAADA
jgi:hypothetical protein